MRTQTLQAPMQVVQMTGDVLVVLANGATRPLLPGEVLPAGTTLQLADDATLQLVPPDGSAPADTANAAPAGDAVPPPATTGVGAEVAAIQQALLEGVDPTLTLEATAAGGAPAAGGGGAGGSGNGGFVSIDRTGDSTLAAAGFDTTYQAGATTDVLNPVAATVVDVPAPIITPDGSSVSESNLNADNELDTDLVDGTQAGQGSTTVQGNLNVDFGGATGSVSFLPVETQPALTSGGQPLVWAVSDDGLTLTGSVNGSVIMTVTLAADGSSYTVDLDGALDNGADPLAIAIGIQAQNDAGAITSGQIVLTVADDAPLAQDDALSVGEDDTATVTGNVLVNDQVGADGAVVTAQTVTNELGSLVLGSDGQYSFTLNSSNPSVQALTEGETLTQVYSYTLTDADGDTSTANLTITITGSDDGIVITDLTPTGEGGEGVVFEDDLANGSDASKESLSVNGTFSVSAPDGLQSITIGGVVVTLAQLQDAAANPVALSSALGNSLTITGFSDGVVSYTYTLLDNETHPEAGNDVLLDNTTILVTDRDGDTASSNLSIQIVDDVPEISIAATPNTVVEGESLTTGTWELNAGADGATVAVIVGGVSYALGEEIDTGKGLLTVANDGTWSFVAADDLDNTDPQTVSFTLKATDGDQDVDEATQTITITDGNEPEWGGEVNSANLTVDEAALSVLGGDTGTDPTSLAETDSSGTLQFKAGSDAIDSIVFGDPSDISIAGIDTDNMVWTLSLDGRTLTGAVGSEDVLKLTLEGASSVAVDGTGNVTVKAELLGNLLHQDDPNAGSLVVSGITVVGADDDGDSLTANVSVTVNDDAPDIGIAATPNTVVEGESLTTGTWELNAGADGATVAVIVGGVSYALGEEIDTGKGLLTVANDGTWSFVAADDLDNTDPQTVSFTLKATDGDQDVDEATQTITITDGNEPEWGGEVNSADLTVDEAALSVLGGDTGTDPTSLAETDSSGTLQFKAGSDAIDSIVFGDPGDISIAGIDTDNMVWTLSLDGRTLTGAVGSEDVLKLTLEGASSVAVDGTGNVTVKAELLGNLLHQDDPNAGSLVVSGITVVGADDDGDSLTADVSVTVNDDAPILTSVESAVLLNSDAGFATGSSVLNWGADQPAIGDLTGNIPGWDGTTVTYAQSSLTSNEQPVYFFVDPNNPETLFAYTSETEGAYDPDSLTQSLIFTLDYQESGDYTLTMDGKLDAPTQEFGASFSTTIGGNQDYLVVTDTGAIYKPDATIPDGQTVVMVIDSAPGVPVNSSQQGLGADGQWIEGDAVINFNFTTPVVSAEFKIDIQSVNEGADTTNDVDWVVYGTDADGNLVTESGTTPFTDGVMTQIPTTLTHITKVELSDHSDLDGSSFRVSGYEVVDRVDEEPFDKSFVVGVTDADGDTANGQLTVTFNPDGDTQLLVGSNANDVAGSSARFITTADAGAIMTGSGDDILVGDEGRSSLVGKSVNLILMLDTSGSMDSKISFDGGHNNTTRLEAMQDAVNNLLANLAGGAADHVRVHIIDFDSTATSLGSFDVKDGELTAAEQAVNQLKQGGMTNYEAALQAALNWLGSTGSDAPLTGTNVINQAIFISDGQPNSWLTGNSSNLANYTDGSESEALKQILGLSGSDSVNEVALLEQLFAQIQAIGINVSANDLNVLNRVEGELANVNPDAATNITTAQQLDDVLANLDPSLVLRDAGNDQLSGDGGNDLLFGDAPFTDTLAHNAGLMLAAGAGWQVFSELEAGQSTVDGYDHWTRADTVAYIQNHAEELAQESGRNLGNDILDGGAGNDYLFGQEGDDQLDGGVGNDQLYGGSGSDEMTGGNGNDVFVWLKGDADKSTDTITDFTIGHDKLDLADVLNDPTGNLSNYLSVTGSGDDALVKVYSAGNASGGGTADLTIVLDGLASTSTELQQLQDYLLNQDGVIK